MLQVDWKICRKDSETDETLGLRKCRQHDLRRTFISLARANGARKDVVQWMSHGPSGDIVDMYTTLPWELLCKELLKIKIELRRGQVIPLRKVAGVADSGSLLQSLLQVSAAGNQDARNHAERLAEEEGFEPPDPCGSTVFKTVALDRSATPPHRLSTTPLIPLHLGQANGCASQLPHSAVAVLLSGGKMGYASKRVPSGAMAERLKAQVC
jgi:hypothetical protein